MTSHHWLEGSNLENIFTLQLLATWCQQVTCHLSGFTRPGWFCVVESADHDDGHVLNLGVMSQLNSFEGKF